MCVATVRPGNQVRVSNDGTPQRVGASYPSANSQNNPPASDSLIADHCAGPRHTALTIRTRIDVSRNRLASAALLFDTISLALT